MKNTQISTYFESREPKAHHLELIRLIGNNIPDFNGNLLDIGCAAGDFLQLVAENFPQAKISGFDISKELIEIAEGKERLGKARLFTADLASFSSTKKYDVICASGVMSIYENFEEPLTRWSDWLKPGGKLFIFGRFNSADIDTIIKFRNNYRSDAWEGGLTAYSCNTITKFCEKLGLKNEFQRFHLPFAIPRNDDPIKTYTVITDTGEQIILNGANIIAEQFHLTISKPE